MEREIPKEIAHYRESVMLGLTPRQTISVIVACACSGLVYYLTRGSSMFVVAMSCGLSAILPSLLGFFSFNGLTFEKLVMVIIQGFVLQPPLRKWRSENTDLLLLQAKEEIGNEKTKDVGKSS